MSRPKPDRDKGIARAFLGTDPGGMVAVPMRTLSDDYHDEPAEPEDSDRVPEPEPEGLVHRLIDRVTHRPKV
jgi:hypothetical protein